MFCRTVPLLVFAALAVPAAAQTDVPAEPGTDIKLAIEQALRLHPGRVAKAEFNWQPGVSYWEVHVVGRDDVRREVRLDGRSLVMLSNNRVPTVSGESFANLGGFVDWRRALGVAANRARGWHLELELGNVGDRRVWEVDVVRGREVTEVRLDARTAKFLGTERGG